MERENSVKRLIDTLKDDDELVQLQAMPTHSRATLYQTSQWSTTAR